MSTPLQPSAAGSRTRTAGAVALVGGLGLLLGGCLHVPFFASAYLSGFTTQLLEIIARPSQRCRSAAELDSDLTAVELSLDAVTCARKGNLRTASLRFALARTFARFDSLRDPRAAAAARQGWPGAMLPALIVQDGLEPDQLSDLQREFRAMAEQPERRRELCSLLRRIGPPSYSLDYVVNERFEVVFPRGPRHDPAGRTARGPAGFERGAAWEEMLTREVSCPAAG